MICSTISAHRRPRCQERSPCATSSRRGPSDVGALSGFTRMSNRYDLHGNRDHPLSHNDFSTQCAPICKISTTTPCCACHSPIPSRWSRPRTSCAAWRPSRSVAARIACSGAGGWCASRQPTGARWRQCRRWRAGGRRDAQAAPDPSWHARVGRRAGAVRACVADPPRRRPMRSACRRSTSLHRCTAHCASASVRACRPALPNQPAKPYTAQ